MSLPESLGRFVAGILVAWAVTGRAAADDRFDNSTDSSRLLSATLKNGELIGTEPVRRVFVKAGTNEFAFILAPGFRMDASNPEQIVFISTDYACYLTFRIVGPVPPDARELDRDTYRELLLSRHPGVKIVNEFSRTVANHSGPAFELQWKNSSGQFQSERTVFVPSAAGVLEFSLVARPDKSGDGQYVLNSFLQSFRSNEGGKLEIIPIPGQS